MRRGQLTIAFVVLAASAQAAIFRGTTTLNFTVIESLGGAGATLSGIIPATVTLQTDYSTISYAFDFDADITLSGGPAQPFETRVEVSGHLETPDPLPISFAIEDGTTFAPPTQLIGENLQFTVTDRVVSNIERHESTPIDVESSFRVSPLFNVANYPTSVWLRHGNIDVGMSFRRITTGPTSHIDGILGIGQQFYTLTELQPGDFNSSGLVDAADYTVWRDSSGFLSPLMTNYGVWRANYGSTSTAAATSIPEPSGLVVMIAVAIGWRCLGKITNSPH